MSVQMLTGTWQFRQLGTEEWLPAAVPGGVHTDLMAAGRIPDPFFGENEKQVKWVADQDWEYRREFTVDADVLAEERVDLICAGLDTLAELSLNKQPLGKTNNMFRQYRWDVKSLLKPGTNVLTIIFRSPVAYIAKRQEVRRLPTMMNGGMAHIRKTQSHFGWDWGPILPLSGVWKDVYLEGYSRARLEDVHIRQHHEKGKVTLSATVAVEHWDEAELQAVFKITSPNGKVQTVQSEPSQRGDDAACCILQSTIDDPQLWWPNGLGAQPLYQVEVSLFENKLLLDQRHYQLGLRTLELRQEADEWGQNFTFVVNGVPIFAKGADWIPADSFPTRLTPQRLEHFIRSAAASNMNMLRVWGGGYYESETFYDLCDRYGILIWQDCMFACAAYPLDEADFLENVHQEIIDNARRLRHHASLALWCGNNEIEMMWGMFKKGGPSLTEACEHFFYHQLPEWLWSLDPDRPYWPSSPSSGEFMKDTNGDARGDTHLWNVWHGLKPFTFFRTRLTRFASEFGLEALPALDTIATFARPEEYSLKSSVFLHHQRSVGGNDKMIYYLTDHFRLPRDFADLVYLTQIMQAEAIRTGVEHWRRNRPRCSGALYWQFNDCWPVTSWASIDYEGRWKALQYAARRFYAPITLSLEDEGNRVGLSVVNDTPAAWSGEARWSLETLSGETIEAGQETITVAALTPSLLRTFDFAAHLRQHGRRNLVFVADLWQGKECFASQVVTFAPEKDMPLPDPALVSRVEAEGEGLNITLSAKALARFVVLSLSKVDEEVIFSDNYFDLPAGRTVKLSCPLPKGWTVEQARQALHVRSLADVQPGGTPFSDRLQHYQAGLRPASLFTRILFSFVK